MTSYDKTARETNSMKGHLALKSSALATDNCKLEKQFLVAQNMASHYKRVLSAKPSIDTKPPKSMVKSQKARDRVKREVKRDSSVSRSVVKRPTSADSSRQREKLFDSKQLNSFRDTSSRNARPLSSNQLNKSMYDMMNNMTVNNNKTVPLRSYVMQNSTRSDENENIMSNSMYKTQKLNQTAKTSLLNTSNQGAENLMTRAINELLNPSLKAMSRLVAGRNYDVLDNHANFFKQPEKEFAPRINKRKAESKLKKTGLYIAPRPRSKASARSARSEHNNSMSAFENDYEAMETNRTNEKSNAMNTERSIVSNHEKSNLENSFTQNDHTQSNTTIQKSPAHEDNIRKKELNLKRMTEKEEELKYLSFIKEVTDDVIARGVCTNRVINNVFEYHISRYKNTLNVAKMRDLLDTLRADIGIPTENETVVDNTFAPTIIKASRYDQEIHSARLSERQSNDHDKYSILDKFGWSSDYEIPKSRSQISNRPVSPGFTKQDTNKLNKTPDTKNNFKTEYERQQNNIVQNIDSIRKTNKRNSISSIIDDRSKNVSPQENRNKSESPDLFGSPTQVRKSSITSNHSVQSNHSSHSAKSNHSIKSNHSVKSNQSNKSNNSFGNKITAAKIISSPDTVSKNNNNNDSFKEDKLNSSRRSSHSDDDKKLKKMVISNDSDEESKNDRDQVDNYFMATLKKPLEKSFDDDDEEETQTKNNYKNRKNNNDLKEKDSAINFDYDFGEKDEDDDDDFDKLLTQTTKRFQNKNLGATLKFEDENSLNDDDKNTPKPLPRKSPLSNKVSDGSDSDSF